jgi:hypothetical protein
MSTTYLTGTLTAVVIIPVAGFPPVKDRLSPRRDH